MTGNRTGPLRRGSLARRLTISVLVGVISSLAMAAPALAKMPYFTVELDTTAPVQGEPINLTVQMFQDAQHTVSADWPDAAPGGLLAIVPADDLAAGARSIPVRLEKIGPGTYGGAVVIDRPGRWVLRAFPNRSGWATSELPPGYPSDIVLDVRGHGPDLAVMTLILGAVVPAAAAGGLLLRRRRSAPVPVTS